MHIDVVYWLIYWNITAGCRVMLILSEYLWCKYWCRLMQFSIEYCGISLQGIGWCWYRENIDDTNIDEYWYIFRVNILEYWFRGSGDADIGQISMMQISMQIDADFEWISWNIDAGGWGMLLSGEYKQCEYLCRSMEILSGYYGILMQGPGDADISRIPMMLILMHILSGYRGIYM